ncbi:hypothetical protein IF2G_00435 [Cordyceps javanica]|nr:hypothetical protein IF2G_00435 [Cordyceps javanica]
MVRHDSGLGPLGWPSPTCCNIFSSTPSRLRGGGSGGSGSCAGRGLVPLSLGLQLALGWAAKLRAKPGPARAWLPAHVKPQQAPRLLRCIWCLPSTANDSGLAPSCKVQAPQLVHASRVLKPSIIIYPHPCPPLLPPPSRSPLTQYSTRDGNRLPVLTILGHAVHLLVPRSQAQASSSLTLLPRPSAWVGFQNSSSVSRPARTRGLLLETRNSMNNAAPL